MNNFLQALVTLVSGLFGGSKKATISQPQPTPTQSGPTDMIGAPVVVSPRVLLIVIDPIVDAATGEKLTQHMKWYHAEDLIATFLDDTVADSSGLARFQVVKRIDVNEFPVKADGFRYTAQSYLAAIKTPSTSHQPDLIDYQDFLKRYNILELVASNQIDEVWAFAFPFAGFYESTMGGAGAFFCNSDPIPHTASCPRRFVVMGLSYERGPGEVLHSFGHRAESIMEQVYIRARGDVNLWHRFTLYDQIAPGEAQIGTIHFPPNGEKDYDYGNTRMVASACDDWYHFPNLTGATKQVNNTEWGGEIRVYTNWWLKHLPKVGGQTNGISNNWWQYILDPNRVKV